MPETMTAGDVKDALHRRYNRPSQGRPGEQYVCIEEARSGAGFNGNDGQCDFLAINTWQSRGMELIGHEVKVSMSDWRAELAAPEKAERFARFCRRWFVAMPSTLATKVKDEAPPAWGLLSVAPSGRVTELVAAKARQPEPVPPWWWVGWLAQIDRQHKRRIPLLVNEAMADERQQLTERVEQQVAQRRQYQDQRDEALRANAQALKEAVGIDLQHAWRGNLDRLKAAWALASGGVDLDGVVAQLRRTADGLAALSGAEAVA